MRNTAGIGWQKERIKNSFNLEVAAENIIWLRGMITAMNILGNRNRYFSSALDSLEIAQQLIEKQIKELE